MYVCNCRGLREREVRNAIERHAIECPLDVHASCGTTPRCGRCLVDMAEIIKDTRRIEPAPSI